MGFIGRLHTQFVITLLQITVTHRLVFSVTVFTALLGNIFQQWTFLCSGAHVLACRRPSHTSLLLFLLPSQNCLAMAAGPHYIASALTAQKTLLPTVTPLLLVTQPLSNNGCFLAPQFLLWANMPHYLWSSWRVVKSATTLSLITSQNVCSSFWIIYDFIGIPLICRWIVGSVMNWNGLESRRSWSNRVTIPELSWLDRGKPRKTWSHDRPVSRRRLRESISRILQPARYVCGKLRIFWREVFYVIK
jgi:hypothetical protein